MSAKNLDNCNRWRNKTVAFRVCKARRLLPPRACITSRRRKADRYMGGGERVPVALKLRTDRAGRRENDICSI